MNRTKIEYLRDADGKPGYTFNPITGCLNSCPYCYARRMFKRFNRSFEPAFYPSRLHEPFLVQKPSRVLACSVADLFGEWVRRSWIEAVLSSVRRYNWHTFLFLTKNPARLPDFNPWPQNAWVGATATDQESFDLALEHLARVEAPVRFLSCEPLLAELDLNPALARWGDRLPIEWLIIGQQTGPGAQKAPWITVMKLVLLAKHWKIPLFLKDNLGCINASIREGYPQEWPK